MLRFYTMAIHAAKPSRICGHGSSTRIPRPGRSWLSSGRGRSCTATTGWRWGRCSWPRSWTRPTALLARRVRVKEVLPDVDGARIDDIVDYITFVFLPMLLLEASGGLYRSVALPVVAVVLLSSMYGFVAPDAKSSDHFFTGFPSYWNIVVLYLMLFRVPPLYNALVLLALSALVFVRIGYVYPSRTPTLRRLTLTLGSTWGVAGRRNHRDVAVAAARGWRSLRSRFPSTTPCSRWCCTPVAGPWLDSPPLHAGARPGGALRLPGRGYRDHRRLVDAAGMGGLQAPARRGRYLVLLRRRQALVPDGRAAARRLARRDRAGSAQRDHRRRGPPLLPPFRHRSDRARPRVVARRARRQPP